MNIKDKTGVNHTYLQAEIAEDDGCLERLTCTMPAQLRARGFTRRSAMISLVSETLR